MFALEHNKDKIKTEGIYFTNCRKFNATTRNTPDLNKFWNNLFVTVKKELLCFLSSYKVAAIEKNHYFLVVSHNAK